ncbi:arsenosugar biosynthesis radical SAM protein ArsS [Dorea acetigenes]|uniref:Arsenosugar biosynthesis radical SAM protein ArsS n=1 Tax=Dorea acetigenes TaxID=2981787 RepID=A0ABT2RJK4_9FIRM|nr:arsenosugar biosynthesis radical SAM (seleno)protein ArsS [Dorea acetigenes]MCU6685583.1 arsenosugar biosynthesis radical SAM protein ArsS [Dorea acetigenes]SCI56482.1 Malonyl-CoA O-methyltransferase BioC [uncultured Clostridium sp.]
MADAIHEQIKEYYGVTLQSSDDLKTNACCCSSAPPRYVKDVLPLIKDEIKKQFYGCGSPIPMGLSGCTALDLGCGTGRDVYILSKLVGERGHVYGVDMTKEQIDVAIRCQQEQAEIFGYKQPNTSFHLGYIEDLKSLGIEDDSVDVVTSNCVINLSPFKEQIFTEVYRVLKEGGELCFSDVFADRRLPDEIKNDPVMRGECMGGAMYLEDFRRLMHRCGFITYYMVEKTLIQPHDFEIVRLVGDIKFYSCTVRAFKVKGLEDREEDYGHSAVYLGTMEENRRYFDFDETCRFIKNKPLGVSRNVAAILKTSRMKNHFTVTGEGETHRGLFGEIALQLNPTQYDKTQKISIKTLNDEMKRYDIPEFMDKVKSIDKLYSKPKLTTMQVNVGYRCNLSCTHCFLECGPERTEMMTKETMDFCLRAFKTGGYEVMDITGGSPEMNPNLEYFIDEASKLGKVIVRTNLTILKNEKYAHFIDVYMRNKVRIVCSLPYYNKKVVEKQRGSCVFDPAIEILQKLNAIGYGKKDELQLSLVYNTDGPYLPPNEIMLENTYRKVLKNEYDIEFTDLIAIGNVPIGRFGQELKCQGKLGSYLKLQSENFNEDNLPGVMCRDQINVDYDGSLYDCEYYHVLGIKPMREKNIADIADKPLTQREIPTCAVCYSCTAGYGSSCGGNLSHG